MNLQQLEYIVALDQLKSFSKAAEACFITQATLSTMVKKLEEELDLVIFDRKTTPVITTECGKAVVEEAKKVVHHAQQLRYISAEVRGKIEGELHLGIIPTVAGNLLHRILPELLEKYPNLKLKIQEIPTEHIIEKLRSGTLDAGIVSTPLKEKDLEERILYYEKLMVYGNNGRTSNTFRSPKEIPQDNIWLLEQNNCLTDQIINLCSLNTKTMHENLHFQPNSFDTLLNIVDQMQGLTLIPELYCHDLPKEKKKKVSHFTAPHPVREISMVYHRPYAKFRLIDAVSEQINRLVVPELGTSSLKNSQMKIAGM